MSKASEIIEALEKDVNKLIAFESDEIEDYPQGIHNKLDQLKQLTEWQKFDKDNPPENGTICSVKGFENGKPYYHISHFLKDSEKWESENIGILRSTDNTLYKELE